MKTKTNYVLASLAIVAGVGSAFASAFTGVAPRIVVKPTSGSSQYICQTTALSCESTGGATCRIRVTTVGGLKTINGHSDNACLQPLGSETGVIVSSISVYAALNEMPQ